MSKLTNCFATLLKSYFGMGVVLMNISNFLNFFEFFKILLINMTIILMSAKMASLSLLKGILK